MVYLLGWEVYNRFGNSPSVPEHIDNTYNSSHGATRIMEHGTWNTEHGTWNMEHRPRLPRARLLPPLWAFTSPGGWD